MEENIIYVQDEDGEEIALYVLEETKFAGVNYLLVTDASEEEDGECYVLRMVQVNQTKKPCIHLSRMMLN